MSNTEYLLRITTTMRASFSKYIWKKNKNDVFIKWIFVWILGLYLIIMYNTPPPRTERLLLLLLYLPTCIVYEMFGHTLLYYYKDYKKKTYIICFVKNDDKKWISIIWVRPRIHQGASQTADQKTEQKKVENKSQSYNGCSSQKNKNRCV